MNKNEIEKKMKRKYRWKFEILPLVILMIPLIIYVVIFTIGLFSFNESLILDSISILNFYIYIIFIWFIIYIIVEFILWFKTRNPGHQLQFLGAILIVIFPILIFAVNILDIPTWTYLENKQIRFIMDIISGILVFSLGLGITFMLIGYYNKEYKASETEMYRNIIVREGENIDEMTDGYSSRISTRNYNEISQISKQKLSALAENYGKTMAREGLLIDWNVKGNKVMFYPMPYTGIGTFKLHILITQLWMLFKKKENLTWISINNSGKGDSHISKYDYDRIGQPVAYHVLSERFMDSFTTSFIHFSKGDEHLSLPYLVGNKTHEEHYKSHKKIKIKMLKKSDILPKIASIITVGIIILSVAMVYVAYIIV